MIAERSVQSLRAAIDKCQPALGLYRAIGDRVGEGGILHDLGRICNALGEKQKSLDFYNQALPLDEPSVIEKARRVR
jgi:hypothetical protein